MRQAARDGRVFELLQALKFPLRRAPKDAPPTFFFHIPKCAGTSVWETLYHVYGARNVFIVNSARRRTQFVAMPLETRLAYSAVGGHGPLGYFHEHLGDMGRYHKIVTLRDPIDRSLSEYNYIRAQRAHPRHGEVAAQSLEEFATMTLRPDRQVTLLTGRHDDAEGAIEVVQSFFDDWALSDDVGALTNRLYQAIGTTPRPPQRKNVGNSGLRRADVAPPTLRLLEEQNRFDLALIEALKTARGQ